MTRYRNTGGYNWAMKKKDQQPDIRDTDLVSTEEMEPGGSPEEYGFPASPTAAQARTWTRQEMFLAEYSNCGAINVSAAAAGHSVEAYYYWISTDHVSKEARPRQGQILGENGN